MRTKSIIRLRAGFLLILLALPPLLSFSQRDPEEKAVSVITPALLKQSIAYLASDSMKGRNTPSPELDAAARYIANQFRSYGLQPFGNDYFQPLDYCYTDLGKNTFLTLIRDTVVVKFRLEEDFIPAECTGGWPAEGGIVFAGYGITAPEFGYDDYRDIDAKGKIVIALRQEPGQESRDESRFGGAQLSPHSYMETKQQNAMKHGAVGLVLVSGPMQYPAMKPFRYEWPSMVKDSTRPDGLLKRCAGTGRLIPVVTAGQNFIRAIFGSTDSLKRIQRRIESTMTPTAFDIGGKSLALNVDLTGKPLGSSNVIAFLEGSDPVLKKEAMVIGAHYDHIGMKRKREEGTDFIYNGADDNASGTSGMLAVAKAFAAMVDTPKRSVIFIAFAGEERGLLGSATYVDKPLVPLGQTVAMINLDMISRNYRDSLMIVGAKLNPGLVSVIRKQNRHVKLKLRYSKTRELDYGSDHANFFIHDVPAIFFFSGFHRDYHRVSDEASRTSPDKAARVARLAFLSAWQIANEGRRYKILRPEE